MQKIFFKNKTFKSECWEGREGFQVIHLILNLVLHYSLSSMYIPSLYPFIPLASYSISYSEPVALYLTANLTFLVFLTFPTFGIMLSYECLTQHFTGNLNRIHKHSFSTSFSLSFSLSLSP